MILILEDMGEVIFGCLDTRIPIDYDWSTSDNENYGKSLFTFSKLFYER